MRYPINRFPKPMSIEVAMALSESIDRGGVVTNDRAMETFRRIVSSYKRKERKDEEVDTGESIGSDK